MGKSAGARGQNRSAACRGINDWGEHAIAAAENRGTLCPMSEPYVSIILRSYNEGWALRETLPALQGQQFRRWELIVIDSGSTDGSVDMLRRAGPRHLIQIRPEQYNP